ncbi:MAG TPA: response regulator [Lachnospiraceae bacterium]|nr:response regulator [Lachnospiraceae bacterium]
MGKKSILLLEDDTFLRSGLKFDLEAEGYKVFECEYCKEASKVIKENHIDLAILDVNLPDGDGFSVCSELKKGKDTARELVIWNFSFHGYIYSLIWRLFLLFQWRFLGLV